MNWDSGSRSASKSEFCKERSLPNDGEEITDDALFKKPLF
jgi:hypothetical protein